MQLLLLALLAASPKVDPAVVAAWGMNGEVLFDLRADGTGSSDGEPIRWSADGKMLRIIDEEGEAEAVPYQLQGGKLVISLNGVSLPLEKVGGKTQARDTTREP